MDPLTAIALGSTIAGGIGSLFGSGSKTEIPEEMRQVYQLLMQRYQEGLSPEAESAMLRRGKTQLGSEAGALGALTESRLTRAGAGTGVRQSAMEQINRDRLRGIGDISTQVSLADEAARAEALNQLRTLAPIFGSPEFKSQYGQGFSDLLQGGLSYLLNRPGSQSKTPTNNPLNQAINDFMYPTTVNPIPTQQPNVNPTPFLFQYGGGGGGR